MDLDDPITLILIGILTVGFIAIGVRIYFSQLETYENQKPKLPSQVTAIEATGTSYTVTGNQAGDVLVITYKGDWTGSTETTITLTVAGSSVDTVEVRQTATTDCLPFTLVGVYVCPNSNDVSVSVSTTAGALANCKVTIIRVMMRVR